MNLVFDIGGTYTRCAGVSGGKIIQKEKTLTPKTFEEGMRVCSNMAKHILKGDAKEEVVVGIAGTFDRGRRKIYRIPQLPFWNGKDISEEFKNMLGVSIVLKNDAELAGLGESVYGAGRGKKIVAYLTVGTGFGGVRIVEGKIDENIWGFEPGRQIISLGEGIRGLGVSGAIITKDTGKNPEEILEESFWRERSGMLSVGITNTILFWSPDVVVLGGSIGMRMDMGVIEDEVKSYLSDIFVGVPSIVRAELGDDSGLWGGVEIVKRGIPVSFYKS